MHIDFSISPSFCISSVIFFVTPPLQCLIPQAVLYSRHVAELPNQRHKDSVEEQTSHGATEVCRAPLGPCLGYQVGNIFQSLQLYMSCFVSYSWRINQKYYVASIASTPSCPIVNPLISENKLKGAKNVMTKSANS